MTCGVGWAVGEEGRGEGAEASFQKAPSPRPLPRSDAHLESHADRGGEGARKMPPTFEIHTPLQHSQIPKYRFHRAELQELQGGDGLE